jgi:hypothetical protein
MVTIIAVNNTHKENDSLLKLSVKSIFKNCKNMASINWKNEL